MKIIRYLTYQVIAFGSIRNPDFGSFDNFPFFGASFDIFVIAHFFGIVNSFGHFITFSSKN